jgi:hypothetical protein
MSNQSARHAAVNAILGISGGTYEGSFGAMFDADSIPTGPFNGRLLAWLNAKLEASYTSLPGAQHAFAVSLGFADWNSLNTWEALASYDEDAQAYFDAVSLSDETYLDGINQFVLDLKAASVWTKLDRVHLRANKTATAAQTCIKSLAISTAINTPTFTAGQGFTFNGSTQCLDWEWAPADGTNWALNSASFGGFIRTAPATGNEVPFGCVSGANQNQLFFGFPDANSFYATVNNPDALTVTTTHGGRTGFWHINRSAAGAVQAYKTGSEIDTGTTASDSVTTTDMLEGALNNSGTPASFFTGQIALSFAGASLNSTEAAALATAVAALKTAIGF